MEVIGDLRHSVFSGGSSQIIEDRGVKESEGSGSIRSGKGRNKTETEENMGADGRI